MKTTYKYERNAICSTFAIEYNVVRYHIMATMLPHNFSTIYVRMLTSHLQLLILSSA